jgi:sporulation protein YlmC with PRC-barrel domain
MARIDDESTGTTDEARTVSAGETGPAVVADTHDEHHHDHDDAVGGPTRLASLSRLKGMDVRDAEGEKVGSIRDVFLDPRAERVRYLSVSTGWLSRGTHVVPIDDVTYVDEGDGRDAHAVVPYSTDHLKGAPSLDDDGEVTPDREREIHGYYAGVGRDDATRDALRARQRTPAPTPQIARAEMADAVARDASRTDRGA